MNILLIDDERDIHKLHKIDRENDKVCICRSFQEGMNKLKVGVWDILYLDHDLASFEKVDGKYIEKTGYDIACFLEENPEFRPAKIVCVSANPVGRSRINQVISRF